MASVFTPRCPASNARLQKTLIALTVSMCLAASILNWIHDKTSAGGNPAGHSLILAQADGSGWSRIAIQPDFGGDAASPFFHFYIDEDGRETFSPAWKDHQPDPQQTGCVVVMFAQRSAGMTPQQWDALVTRVRTLQAQYRIATTRVTLDSDRSPAAPDLRGEVEQLNRMLQTAGLVG